MKWLKNNTILVSLPKRPKKITGTRFGAILGFNSWNTPFSTWCEITRTYEKPFEDTIYTIAGKTIEPKQAEYMRQTYIMNNLITPTDVYGADYFKKTYGDFFPEEEIFGGMWDYLLVDKEGKPTTVLEMKTTKRVEDWDGTNIPEHYALQAALYAYLLGADNVIMVCSILDPADYEHPENFICDSKNTITRPFKVSERYPHFEEIVQSAVDWWNAHVVTGISPQYDEKADSETLKALRTNNVSPKTDLSELLTEAENLKAKLDENKAKIADDEKRYKTVTDMLKQLISEQFREGDKKVSVNGDKFVWEVVKSESIKIDKEAMQADGILDKYSVTENSYRLTIKENK